jgi:hypothetical protein
MKEALEEELRARVALALEAKMNDEEEEEEEEEDEETDEDEEDDLDEEVEQIDEISAAKIGTYIVKARKSVADLDKKIDKSFDDDNTPENKAKRKTLSRKMNKRRWGQGKAMDKLTSSSFAKVPATEK